MSESCKGTVASELKHDIRGGTRTVKASFVAAGILLVYAGLLAFLAARISPVCDEVGHLAAGMYIWEFGRFDLYRVNPPLVRVTAGWPIIAFLHPRSDWRAYRHGLGERPEWRLGQEFIRVNDQGNLMWLRYFVAARWTLIPIVVFGGYICYRWGSDLYGPSAGLVATCLWCTSPDVLAWGSTICPDAAAGALGAAACYCFWRWLRKPDWTGAFIAGLVLGLAELTKMTWTVLFVVEPALWLVWRWRGKGSNASPAIRAETRDRARGCAEKFVVGQHPASAGQMAMIVTLAVCVVNLGYFNEGSFTLLRDYTFVSHSLAGGDSLANGGSGGNRFQHSWLGLLPVPFPREYLSGADLQKLDFERGDWSYLLGEWRPAGKWYYYVFAAMLKLPLGTWILASAAAATLSAARLRRVFSGHASVRHSDTWNNELVLVAPALAVLVLVSSQTGFSRYFRYVLPCFPFLFIWVSKVARSGTLKERVPTWICAAALSSSITTSLWSYPHSMSYFNELAGGPTRGHRYLIDACIDWGQDISYLKRWLDKHPEARPLSMACLSFVPPKHFALEYPSPPKGRQTVIMDSFEDADSVQLGPQPGWFAMSVHRIYSRTDNYRYFLRFKPVAMAGYSIYIYHITEDEANGVRREMGLRS